MPDKIGIYDVGDRYDLSDSENEYDEREKKLLKGIRDRKGKGKGAADNEEEVLGFDEGDESEEDEDDDIDIRKFEHDSDIEDKEDDDDLPDRKAWGDKARAFYGADYVDQDYDSLTAQEEERAQLEEIEAKEIQQRLAKELNEADFSLDVFVPEQDVVEEKKGKSKKKEKTEIKLKADLSDLSERQKRELFRKEAPEFDGLVEDFERNLEECHTVFEPVLKYLREKDITDHPFVELLKTRYDLCLSYCNNISFYLLLKSKKSKVKNHPVVKRMVQMKQLLLELEQKYENSIKSQVETILEHIAAGDELVFEAEQVSVEVEKKPKGKKKLTMLQGVEEAGEKLGGEEEEYDESESDEPTAKKVRLADSDSEEEEQGDEMPQEEDEEQMEDGKSKRKITYQMAKNKGLTVRKKKDDRNIRVKNRRKFQKALVRRKGTVRPVRTETTRYAGEATGIKAFVKRSVKIK
ncbi:something about silencing protein 10 [Ochlerotatus camptorhynchus]|uniref:something about silencing protein 10 n=1 Tax=Ochlerotatus camptorhynchus TaxID=644619 RepID=UPI0031D1F8C1